MIDTDKLAAERDQIWAEAVVIYRQMCQQHDPKNLPLYLTGPSEKKAKALQEEYREENQEVGTAAMIAEWAETPKPLSVFSGDAADPDFTDEDEPMVVPVYICAKQAYISERDHKWLRRFTWSADVRFRK